MIVITAATGHLGRHVVTALLAKVPPAQLAIAVRDPAKAQDLAAQGIAVRHADYEQPQTLRAAFAGADKVLLISGNDLGGGRARQHKAAVGAALEAGVRHLVYTSILGADRARMGLAVDHLATEQAITAAGIPATILRNGWYLENYTENLGAALAHGVILGAAGTGKVAAAARRDYAEAAAAVLTTDGHVGKTYELAGDAAFTMAELAAAVAEQAGKPVAYQDMPEAAYRDALVGFGLPAPLAAMLADSDTGITRGELASSSTDLRTLIGRPTTTLRAAIAAALAK
ncbi:MAG: SDR family oxidoreductase [Deltaproteobacteria bacterium]|nr:SDR family oxidoreductase [Deltaproteobacteria bacterium]